MTRMELYKQIVAGLSQPLPGLEAQKKMAPSTRNPTRIQHREVAQKSAVTLLLFQKLNNWYIALIKRNIYHGKHSAQISFPGGKYEESDQNLLTTAIRETHEEIGIKLRENQILGELSSLYIPISNFIVHPYIALLEETPVYQINDEVQYIIEYPLEHLCDPLKKEIKTIESQDHLIEAPIYICDEDYIWGATAMILSEFSELINCNR